MAQIDDKDRPNDREFPFPNEHSIRLQSPDKFDDESFRRTKGSGEGKVQGVSIPSSIDVIWAKLKGKAKPSDPPVAQALRFPIKKWTEQQARDWISENKIDGSFEAATGDGKEQSSPGFIATLEEAPDAVKALPSRAQDIWLEAFQEAWIKFSAESPKERESRSAASAWAEVRRKGFPIPTADRLFNMNPQTQEFAKVKINADGSAIFSPVVPFAEGTWTNGGGGPSRTVTFLRDELSKTLTLWDNIPVWMNHPTNAFHEHEPTDHIGFIRSPRMNEGRIEGDLHAHGKTQASRDAIGMWESGMLIDLSAEITSQDIVIEQAGNKQLVGTDVRPFGVAWVLKGACTVCKVEGKGMSSTLCPTTGEQCKCNTHTNDDTRPPSGGGSSNDLGGSIMDEAEQKELQEKLDKAEATIKELNETHTETEQSAKDMAAQKDKDAETIKELTDSVKELTDRADKVDELEKELTKIKELPVVKSLILGEDDVDDEDQKLFASAKWDKRGKGSLQLKGPGEVC